MVTPWLKNCIEGHQSCGWNSARKAVLAPGVQNLDRSTAQDTTLAGDPPASFLPSRLIDVGVNDAGSEPKLCLKEHMAQGSHKYICLSHCWGSSHQSKILTTTKETINIRLKCIPMAILPKTFHDAVSLTRKLGIRHIWIDSLCIIQDSTEDWVKESANMGDIYWNSFLTLAASSASDPTEGLFRDRESNLISPCVLTWPDQGTGALRVVIHPSLPYCETALSDDPLGKRAWKLQERDLSPRVLYFGTRQLYRECREEVASEQDPRMPWQARPHFNHMMGRSRLFDDLLYFDMEDISHNQEELLVDWYSLIKIYSQRNMTFPKDKLPAVSGLANKAREFTGDAYVAGLWKSDMIRGMMRYGTNDSTGVVRTAAYRVPSWSWASVDGPIEWPLVEFSERNDRHRPKVTHTRLEIASRDNTGQVAGGFIVLNGRVKTVARAEASHFFPSVVYTRSRYIHLELYNEVDGQQVGTVRLDDGADGDMVEFLVLKVFEEKADAKTGLSTVRALALGPTKREGYMRRIVTVTVFAESGYWFDNEEPMSVVFV